MKTSDEKYIDSLREERIGLLQMQVTILAEEIVRVHNLTRGMLEKDGPECLCHNCSLARELLKEPEVSRGLLGRCGTCMYADKPGCRVEGLGIRANIVECPKFKVEG